MAGTLNRLRPSADKVKMTVDVTFTGILRSYGDRKKRIEDSSAFEHIFVGESRDGAILGFHNWLRFYQLEALGYIDYRGYYVSTNILSGEP